MHFHCGRYRLDLTTAVVMGIVNVTPDSFSDGGRFSNTQRATAHALQLIEQGAAIVDIGGESTRPGAPDVPIAEELSRVIPVVEALRSRCDVPISVDTSKPEVIRAAIEAGASMINDVRALREPGAVEAVAATDAGVCLMHMQGQPRTMQHEPHYQDVVSEVAAFLDERVAACEAAGVDAVRLLLDPGIGFGKRLEHNLRLLAQLPALSGRRLPLLIGVSRKSMFRDLLGREVDQRLPGSLAVATAAVLSGARVLRVHDVAQTVDAVKVAQALLAAGYPGHGMGGSLTEAG